MADGSIGRTARGRLGEGEVRLLLSLAEAATPVGEHVRAPSVDMVQRIEALLEPAGGTASKGYAALLHALDLASLPTTGQRLSELPLETRMRVLGELADGAATHWLVRAATTPMKLAQVTRPGMPDHLGANVGLGSLPVVEEHQRWGERVMDARELPDGETIEVDCVVVGTGAGGAPVAHALAAQGHAVLVLEEGGFYTRKDFRGRAVERGLTMQKQRALFGNAFIALPTGSTVGGSTTINSGTCLRTPPEVMRRWRFEHGLVDVHPESMEPFFRRVEAMLEVTRATPETLGGCARVVARGAEALGWSHHALPRNAPGCDGQGLCCFGCPTDAKRSTNVSYLPAALDAGAMLFHHARVEEVLIAGGRAVGVVARAKGGNEPRVRVLAKTVVLSGGSIGTPAMLLRQGLANSSGEVGRNLTVHPCSNAWALFDETIEGWKGIPQGYGIDEFAHEGIRFEGAFVPLDVAAPTLPAVGRAWTDFVDRFDRMACFGFMLAETSRGRVILGPGGEPQLAYYLNDTDRRRMIRGQALLARMFLAAGAKAVITGIHGWPTITSESDVERLEREAPETVGASRLDVAAFHPLGTCRMGRDPKTSVVGPTNETHDVPNLFLVDGSTVNGPLGVNPQVTIMAMAERASGYVDRRIEAQGRTPARPRKAIEGRPAIEFTETMSGRVRFRGEVEEREAAFTVRCATSEPGAMARGLLRPEGGVLVLEGTATIEGLATRVPCVGTLAMHPKKREGTLVYDLDLEGDDGLAYHLHGEKSVKLSSVLSGMTTLATEIARSSDGQPVAKGTLRFAMSDLLPWLATFRFRAPRG